MKTMVFPQLFCFFYFNNFLLFSKTTLNPAKKSLSNHTKSENKS